MIIASSEFFTRGEESTCNAGDTGVVVGRRGKGLNPWVGKITWRKAGQLTPVFLPGESQGPVAARGTPSRTPNCTLVLTLRD